MQTVAAYAPRFLEIADLKTSTRIEYGYVLEKHLLPAIGKRRLDRVTTGDLDALQRGLRSMPARANRVVNVVCSLLRVARRDGLKAATLERPKRLTEKKRTRYLTRDEAARLLAVLDERHDAASKVIRLLLLTGCRKSEILSLRWTEVDFGLRQLRLEDGKCGARVVPLCGAAADILAALPRHGDYVFPGAAGHAVTVRRAWDTIRRRAGVPDLHLHDLRHSWASFAVSGGTPLAVVGAVLGHRCFQTTMRYAHVHESAQLAAVDAVGALLGGAR